MSELYSCAAGSSVAGGRHYRPAWRRAIAANTIGQISADTMMSVDPSANPAINPDYPNPGPWHTRANLVTVTHAGIVAYSGALWDEDTLSVIMPLQGGHADSGDNGAYRFRLSVDSPVWDSPRPPSGSIPFIAGGLPSGSSAFRNSFLLDDGSTGLTYADSRPRSSHTWNGSCWVPGFGVVIPKLECTFSNGSVGVSGSTDHCWSMNKDSWVWTNRGRPSTTVDGFYSYGHAATYDPTRNCIYRLSSGSGKLVKIDLLTWAWSLVMQSVSRSASGVEKLIYVQEHDFVVGLNGNAATFELWNLADATRYVPPVATAPISINANIGSVWVSALNALVFWDGQAGNKSNLYLLKAPASPLTGTWTWEVRSFGGITPPTAISANQSGTYGRFMYSAKLNGFVVVNRVTEPTVFFALD